MAKRKVVPRIRRVNTSDLFKETQKQLIEVEKRLSKLEKGVDVNRGTYNPRKKRYERKGDIKRVSYSIDSWAGKKLKEKLSTIRGIEIKDNIKKIKIPKNISTAELKAVNKAFDNFLKSQTSTIKGIRNIEKNTKDSIKDLVSDIDNIDNSDVETLYTFFSDKDFNYVTQYIDPSELMVLIAETKAEGGTTDDFLRKIENYIYSDSLYQDEDLVNALTRLYEKF